MLETASLNQHSLPMRNPAIRLFVALVTFALLLAACGDPSANGGIGSAEDRDPSGTGASPDTQLNVTLLLDLSDRVDPEVSAAQPPHRDRDLEAAATVTEAFIEEMEAKGAFRAEGRIRTIFSPPPSDAGVNAIAQSLATDLRGMSPADKKVVHDSLPAQYRSGLSQIYDAVIDEQNYIGADIWRFFSDGDARNLAIDTDDSVRNVLVVITDGYVYHAHSTHREGNRTAFVTPVLLRREGLRDANSWRERFDEGDYGFIDPGVDLPELEVLVLEMSPSDGHPGDFAVLRAYWEDLLESMEVERYEILKTDLPTNTKPLILDFLDGA